MPNVTLKDTGMPDDNNPEWIKKDAPRARPLKQRVLEYPELKSLMKKQG